MATKTFKIGLSNTDKQNMAQEVYERLLALTFPEYETTESYDVGDFVVYNDQLYKCIGETTGAWDSSKWQLATLNDLLTDIEDAVAFVNDKANVDGNYPTMTVGFADALTPYDSDSGDDQDEPFSFQATGTGNGTQPDFATGSTALMKEKRGNSVVVNQQVNKSNLISSGSGTGWSFTSDQNTGEITFVITETLAERVNVQLTANDSSKFLKVPVGHKYFYTTNLANTNIVFMNSYIGAFYSNIGIEEQTGATNGYILLTARLQAGLTAGTYKIKPIVVDLTQWFNGDIPQDLLDNPDHFFRYYQGDLSYNAGTLVNANGRYLKTWRRNDWDEEWELGAISNTTGENTPSSSNIRSKNYIKVIPNTTYYFKASGTGTVAVAYFYDINDNFIGYGVDLANNNTFTIPSNINKMRFVMLGGYGTTYNHDITISIYYEDESGYDQYYPYEVLTNNDTGTEVLRSAGNVADSKAPDGTITRRVGVVDLSTLTWDVGGGNRYALLNYSNNFKKIGPSVVGNGICSTMQIGSYFSSTVNDGVIGWYDDGSRIVLNVKDNGSDPTGTLFYELATPTEEQGTPYSENLFIDDFGSMDFAGTNGVPQGNLIFYPVDYKAFIDTLYNYTDGTPSELAKKSDLSADKSELQGVDSQLKNAIGGTLRHLLVAENSGLDFNDTNYLDLGSVDWTKGGTAFSTTGFATVLKIPASSENCKLLCSNYKMICKSANSVSGNANTYEVYITSGGQLVWYYPLSEFADGTAFKNAMKGVLLAYEKAQ